MSLLEVRDLVKEFPLRGGVFNLTQNKVQAVSGVSFDVEAGQTHGLVGESGCGKSTVARTILRLHKATSGSVFMNGRDLLALSGRELREARSDLQIIFQDPFASLNPRMTVRDIVGEPLIIHKRASGAELRTRVDELLDQVGLDTGFANRYPHQFSGGQRQRIGIARALALDPKLIVCDEPVSALDVSIQAQVINLLKDIQEERGLAYLFIAHDLAVVRHISDVVSVMYLGRIVETGPIHEIYDNAQHPYTQALLSAVPEPDPQTERTRKRLVLTGDVPDPIDPPSGCRFRTRCWKATDLCTQETPALVDPGIGHAVACHYPEPLAVAVEVAAASGEVAVRDPFAMGS